MPNSTVRTKKKSLESFQKFILEKDHPCIMAQSVFSMGNIDYNEYRGFGSREAACSIIEDLSLYIDKYDFESRDFASFLAAFPNDGRKYTEEEFEKALWQQIRFLHEEDTLPWDTTVASDPADPAFSLSLAGRAFYLVGMHPGGARKARQAPFPTIVFNLHWQFEKLREMNTYTTVRDKIRQRDIQLQGNINPMLTDFGKDSEARQYSGRKVGEEWKCPFLHKKK